MTNRHSISDRVRRVAPLLLIGLLAACGPTRRGAASVPPTELLFTNESLSQADVYIVAQGLGTRRIGSVMSGQTATLRVPASLSMRGGVVNIVARLLAHSGTLQTGPVSISPGERYEVRLPSGGRVISFLPARS
jgi:hypothetical protein